MKRSNIRRSDKVTRLWPSFSLSDTDKNASSTVKKQSDTHQTKHFLTFLIVIYVLYHKREI